MRKSGSTPARQAGSAASAAHRLSTLDRSFRILGGCLNLAVLALAVARLAGSLGPAWHPALIAGSLLAFAAATFAADLTSGLLHWGFDTWFSTTRGPFRRMVSIVREHHTKPDEIFTFRFATDSGMLSWFAGSGAFVLLVLSQTVAAGHPVLVVSLCLAAVVYSVDVSLMFEYHKWGHRRRRGPVPRFLQRCGLLLSPDHHLRHHRGAHDSHYCLINGLADRTLGEWGFFRGLERLITAVTGVPARAEDHAILARLVR
ncbi:fatty acid desaturase CarF family protein [Jatrophihabitans sp.]|uniref:fatty acid desaturase CarF family protein n=1 Tax=Jatrophihabitans sp. TaxID=1932789 RepID=UPI002C62C4D9|nr:fatty acid desaturase CarF family protein [Jatrophihabitans sp.]